LFFLKWIRDRSPYLFDENNYSIFKNKVYLILTLTLVILTVCDIITTFYALSIGGHEGNPILKHLVSVETPLTLYILKFAYLCVFIWFVKIVRDDKRTQFILTPSFILINLIYVIVVGNNLFQLSILLHK
jgi:FtsH-binding integral membrane protein